MEPISALIGAGANLIGGLLGQSSADANRDAQLRQAELNREQQERFAKNAIQWKVADAQAAGIHPLYALGASTSSYSPVSIGSTADNSLGEAVGRMGQDISRAVSATADTELRKLNLMATKLDVERKGLENDVLRAELGSKISRLTQPGNPPALSFPVTAATNPKVDQEKQTNQIRLFGKTLLNDPHTSDAQTAEDILGEGVSDWLWPFVKIPSMIWYNRGDAEKFRIRQKRGRRAGFTLG